MKRICTILFSVLLLYGSLQAQDRREKVRSITVGQEYTDSLALRSSHTYVLDADSGRFVYGFVDQLSVDVEIEIKDPTGKIIGAFDIPARGKELFQFDTEETGKYSIKVMPFEDEEGRYSFTVSLLEAVATESEERVDQLMISYSGDEVPGAAAMAMKDGEIIFAEAYGMASLTYDIPFEVDTRTNIGSTSKQFTAFAAALLAERGKISLDDNVRKYIPELPEFEFPVTIRNLLTHTSGYREYLNTLAMRGHDLSSSLDRAEIIEVVQRQPDLQNKPGAEWNYNNTGFALMVEIIERVTETPFPEWMQENVFNSLQMNHSMVRHDQNQVVPGRSQGYAIGEGGNYVEMTDLGGAMGAGGIYTTLKDLAKWIRNFEDPKVGNEDIIREMTTPFVLTSGDTTGYGLGLFVQEYKGLKYIHHGGADVAHRSMLMYFPEIDAAVVTQSNNANFRGDIPQKIADLFFGEYMQEDGSAPVEETQTAADFEYDPENFEPLTGRYELKIQPGFILTFSRDGDRIYTQATGQPEIDIRATSDSTFSLVGVNADITFHRNEDGSADSLTLHQNGHHVATRIEWNPSQSEMKEYSGTYLSNELQTFYTIAIEDSSLVLKHYSMDDMTMTPGDKDSFSAGFPIAEMKFVRNEEGEIVGFEASNGRTMGVLFEKWEE
ncbi:serine hydrolase [Balneolaceae bacterium YR4-1]|uniref:Serine hydrolase n=1 Tax=Halalkalibaculum roseum TaxID=2709311 RepID=A0A6M1SQV2_9BACT|nr:serine hydrolase [Halalkalibaculum roseum]NGP77781.1 serine hydrolase [Halalkalibaculum roseum]